MRKLLAIALLAVFGLPILSPLFALTANPESRLPACCRRNGKHHCMMGVVPSSGDHSPAFSVREKCPYERLACTAPVTNALALRASAPAFAALLQQTHVVAHASPGIGEMREGSHPQRGPPLFFSL